MSIQRPVIRKPKTPKIKKPLISKRKRIVKKAPTLSVGRIKTKTSQKKHITHKKPTKTIVGTCYLEENCKGVISRKITKSQCKRQGGKSWKKVSGNCEKL
ncbi:MAG: hypothetical protein K5777_07540 [Nitrosopumilus sp.]|nr:hypothetical protein [Nitrosopumilus sp.]